jgi:hypothetical protein
MPGDPIAAVAAGGRAVRRRNDQSPVTLQGDESDRALTGLGSRFDRLEGRARLNATTAELGPSVTGLDLRAVA